MPLRGRLPTSRNSSVVDFDLTSTVIAPTESENEEYTSNVSALDLKKDFFTNYSGTTNLPIHASRRYVINSINSYSTVIIEGATGSGKTTQVPMYILEDAILDKGQERSPIIYVTQPRKIAARSIAQRICDEHGWQVGSIVGYQVGLDKVVGPQTVLVFCTAGVLLQKLITEKSLKNYTHIIIDEAHERDADTDLLMMMIRTLMRSEMCFFRLIIMSATMDMSKLKNYFTFRTNYGHRALKTPSICKIDTQKKPTDIQLVYFDKLRPTFGIEALPLPEFDFEEPDLAEESLKGAAKIIIDVVPHLDTYCEATKSTLVFLPGLAEIHRMHRLLKHAETYLDIIPLHSCISAQDQIKVFLPSRPGCRKVILATNIAESSITVKDVGFIVDFCLTKVLMKDEVTRFPTLKLQWSTIDKCTQRAGRTGRCCPGKVFRMVSLDFFRNFEQYAKPELLTGPLELSVLRIKNFQMGEVKELMASVIDPPPVNEIRTAVLELKQIGGLSSTYEGRLNDLDGDLTELGKVISALPIDVHLSKLIVLAASFDVLEDAIIVAACLSTNRSIVRHLYERELESYQNKLDWSRGSHSDLFVALDVYKEFAHNKRQRGKDLSWLGPWCARKNLDDRKLYEVSSMIEELTTRLEQQNIMVFEQPNRQRNENEDELMLKIAFCAAFYPNYFLTKQIDAEEVDRELCGLDPAKTVILHNFPTQSAPLYRTQILDQFDSFTAKDKDFLSDTSRAYLVFNNDTLVPEDLTSQIVLKTEDVIKKTPAVSRSVYFALRYGLFNNIFIREFKEQPSCSRMLYYESKRTELKDRLGNKLMPARSKLVVGRRADNSHLLFADPEKYEQTLAKNYFYEVEFNQRQDFDDRQTLHELERKEGKVVEIQRRGHFNNNNNNSVPVGTDHPLFKPSYREIHGPTSPIKITFRSVLSKSSGYPVEVDSQSVNSILLNTDYKKPRSQMLVAASVGHTKKGRVLARDTTLMPNIRGLPTIMALLFAQYYRIVYNEDMKCLGGAIFGIGWYDENTPVNSNYEVQLGFDVFISTDDIELINEARQKISRLIKFNEVTNPGAPQAKMQQELRQIILAIIGKRRFALSELDMVKVDYSEGKFVRDKHNVPESQTIRLAEGQTRPFLPVAKVTKNYSSHDLINSIRENLEKLRKIEDAEEKPPLDGINCLLCGSGMESFFMFRPKIIEHLRSKSHNQRLLEFEVFVQRTELNESIQENGHNMARLTL